MSTDVRLLFERAERDIRPEFRDELLRLLDDDQTTKDATTADVTTADARTADARTGDMTTGDVTTEDATTEDATTEWPQLGDAVVIDLDRAAVQRRHSWGRPAAVAVAAVIVLVLGIAALVSRSNGDGDEELPASELDSNAAACVAEAEPLEVVPTASIEIRVGLMPDGSTFCLVNNLTEEGLEAVQSAPDVASGVDSTQARIFEQGVVGDAAHYFLVAVPDGMPVDSVGAPSHQIFSFPTSVGRTFLVIDPGPSDSEEHVGHDLQLLSVGGSVLATLVADIDAALPTSTIGEAP